MAVIAEPLPSGDGKRLMRVADVMSREVELVPPDATVREAATSMAEYDVGAVLIGAGESLEGILTDRDIILRAVVDGRNPAELRVRDIMSTTLFTCRDDDTLEQAFRIMSERQVRRLPVLDRDGHLAGIVTLSDLGRLERDPQSVSATLRELAEPHRRKAVAEPEHASPDPESERGRPEDTL
jgi:CBS domain-containing protein